MPAGTLPGPGGPDGQQNAAKRSSSYLTVQLLLLSATEFEVEPLTAGFTPLTHDQLPLPGGFHARHGQLGAATCVAVATGVGKVNAAAITALAVTALRPQAVLLVGIGGAYPGSGPAVGEPVMALSDTHLDTGVGHGAGWSGVQSIGFPLLPPTADRPTPVHNQIELPGDVARLAERIGVRAAHFGTSEAVTADPDAARLLHALHGVAVESMEGAAVAQVTTALGVPLYQLRGISNLVGDRDKANWRVAQAVSASCDAALRAAPLLLEAQ